jgi:hypothetical protein
LEVLHSDWKTAICEQIIDASLRFAMSDFGETLHHVRKCLLAGYVLKIPKQKLDQRRDAEYTRSRTEDRERRDVLLVITAQ